MTKIYRPFVLLRILYLLVFLFDVAIFAGLLVLFSSRPMQNLFPILIVCLLSGYMLFGFFRMTQIRLEISEDGIKYYSGSYVINTAWDNVERVGKRVFGLGRLPVEGLVLRNPSATKKSFMARFFSSNIMSLFPSSDRTSYEADYSRSIPLQGIWSGNWRKSKVAEDIKQYVPDLFEKH